MQGGPGRIEKLRRRLARRISPPPRITHFNDAVNPETGVIYVAIPKTGSTTIRRQISPLAEYASPRYFVRDSHLDIVQIRDGLAFFAQAQALGRNDSHPGTTPTTAALSARSRDFFTAAFKFSAVRNPWARAVSLFFRKEGVQLSERMSFAEFIESHAWASDTCRSPTAHRSQLDWLIDESGALAVDYVFRIEDLAEKADEIRERSGGRVVLEVRRENVNQRSRSNAYREMFDDRLKALVAARFERDIDTFGYTF